MAELQRRFGAGGCAAGCPHACAKARRTVVVRAALASVLLSLATSPPAGAQVVARPLPAASPLEPGRPAAVPLAEPGSPERRADGARDGAVRVAGVVTPTTPGAVTVIRVPVPVAVLRLRARGSGPAYFAIRSVGGVRLVNGQEGAMQPLPATREAVAVSIIVNRRLAAGPVEVAVVEFTAGTEMVDVPVVVEVARVGAVTLQVPDRDVVVPPGVWAIARVRLVNHGNGDEQVSVQAVAPGGWRVRGDSSVTMRAGAIMDATLRLWAPSASPPGLQFVRVLLTRGKEVLAEGQLRATVPPSVQSGAGLVVTLSSIGVSSPEGTTAMGYGLNATGRISDSTDVTVRTTLGSSADPAASFALARSGFLTMPPVVSVRHPRRALSGGVLSTVLRDPAGAFLSGLGVSGSSRHGGWVMAGFGGRPFGRGARSIMETANGLLAGGSLDRVVGRNGAIGVQAIHLDDALTTGRIESVTLHGSHLPFAGGILSVAAAQRRVWDPVVSDTPSVSAMGATAPRRTLGASAQYTVQSTTGSFDLRLMHSPGGGRALARTGSEVAASGSQRFGRVLAVSGSGWLQTDANPAIGDVHTAGWNASPMFTPRSWLSLALDGRGSEFDLATANIVYHNSERVGGASADVRAGAFYARLSASAGTAARRTSVDSLTAIGSGGQRLEEQAILGVNSRRGTFEVTWSHLAYRGATLAFPQQQTLGVRLDRFQLFSVAGEPLLVSVDAQRLGAEPGVPAPWTIHGEVRLPLTKALGLTLAADRNPFVVPGLAGGATRQVTYSLRMDQQLHMPVRATTRGRRRVVFMDDNGNGTFDRGEEPVSGVAVRCGEMLANTDDTGGFRCPGAGTVELDVRTLPLGVLPPAQERLPEGDIALSRVRPVTVRLTTARADSARVPISELDKAMVMARDTDGTRWVGRSSGSGAFVFDALPLGRYVLEFEQAGMREAVTLAGGPTEVWVRRDHDAPAVELTVKPRPARIKSFGTASAVGASVTEPRAEPRTPHR